MPGFPSGPRPTDSGRHAASAAVPPIPVVPSHWTFPAHPASVRRARRAVSEALPYGCRSQLADGLRLLTSELVTNAVTHGARAEDDEVIEMILWAADGHYWLAVSDPGVGNPARTPAAPDAEGGRGLLLVNAVAAAWAVVPRPVRGKSVVIGVPLHGG